MYQHHQLEDELQHQLRKFVIKSPYPEEAFNFQMKHASYRYNLAGVVSSILVTWSHITEPTYYR